MPVTAVCVCATTQVAAEVTHSCPHATFSIAGITENQEFPANTAQSQDVLASQERYRTDKAELDAALEQWSTRRRHYVKHLSTVWVYAEVFQNDIGKVKVGDPASITVDAYPGKTFPARVSLGPVNLHHDRYIANMLRGHTAEDTDSLLRNTQGIGGDSWLWLVREVEGARGERLINEVGKLRHK
jgi:hypothetical protein